MNTNNQRRALVVLSGGQDSATCAFYAKDLGYEVHAVTFDYGQRHRIELEAAEKVADLVGAASHEVIVLGSGILESTSPLISREHELEQYPDHHSLPGGIEKTFVPLRNQLFLTIAANRAVARGCEMIFTGVCEEDFGGYPDCRQVFIDAVQAAINLSNEGAANPIEISTPLMFLTKAQSVRLALRLPGCYAALAYTHTAYDGQYPPIGRDHATLLRAKGFEEAGVPDPLVMRAHAQGLMPLPMTANYDNDATYPVLKHLDLVAWANSARRQPA